MAFNSTFGQVFSPTFQQKSSGEDEYISALMTLPEILVELKRSNVLAESIYKLVEADLMRRR